MNVKPKHGLSASRDETLHTHSCFCWGVQLKTLCAVISHDISESDCCAFTCVKTTELIAFCCISWSFFAYFVCIAKYSGASACCVDYTELSSRVLALPLHRTDLHVSLKQLQPNMQICFCSLCVYLIWSLFLDFSLLFCFHFLYSETVSYNYGTCSWRCFYALYTRIRHWLMHIFNKTGEKSWGKKSHWCWSHFSCCIFI